MVAQSSATAADPKLKIDQATYRTLKRTRDMFLANHLQTPTEDTDALRSRINAKVNAAYARVKDVETDVTDKEVQAKVVDIDSAPLAPSQIAAQDAKKRKDVFKVPDPIVPTSAVSKLVDSSSAPTGPGTQLVTSGPKKGGQLISQTKTNTALVPRSGPVAPKPKWRAPWKLYRVIAGHAGWVRSVDVDSTNEWFCTGANDRTIKIWDLASGTLKLTLTGHISAVTGLAVSPRHPYLFSVGEDKMVKCWDLETNSVVRSYHGHLSSCYDVKVHPTLDVIITASRDSTARVWDMRTKACVHVLAGHTDGVNGLAVQGANPQVTTVSYDTTVKLWDIGEGRTISTLTNHKKSVRGICQHPSEFNFATGSADNIKKWNYPNGEFQMNMDRHAAVVNSMAVNQDGVMVSGADNGTLQFYDWTTGYCFQKYRAPPQPGSLASENGVYALSFDKTGSRLISCEADKSVKFYKEDDSATEESHPVQWNPTLRRSRF